MFLLIFITLLFSQLLFTVQFLAILTYSLHFCLSLLSAAHTVRWLAQPWAATAKDVHFGTTTCVLLKQVSECIFLIGDICTCAM